jgi:hypothetical protein
MGSIAWSSIDERQLAASHRMRSAFYRNTSSRDPTIMKVCRLLEVLERSSALVAANRLKGSARQ